MFIVKSFLDNLSREAFFADLNLYVRVQLAVFGIDECHANALAR